MAENEMQSKKLAGSKPGPATKRYLDIAEIKEDTVVMKDGTLRAVMLVSSINFALKSEDEQNAIIQQYVSFLNALEFPVQIVIQSRRLNIDKYLETLKENQRTQENELLKIMIADYRAFVAELISIGQIMQKQFFCVVPYNPVTDTGKSFFSRLSEAFSPSSAIRLAEKKFQGFKTTLDMRTEHIGNSLSSMGLKAVRLDTQSLIELYYRAYNPELIDTQKMIEMEKMGVIENEGSV